jgi:hypothetical protein
VRKGAGRILCVPKIKFCNIDGEGRQGQVVRRRRRGAQPTEIGEPDCACLVSVNGRAHDSLAPRAEYRIRRRRDQEIVGFSRAGGKRRRYRSLKTSFGRLADVADQILFADSVVDSIAKLRQEHVGLTVLVNRYDGIDLPHEACRVLAIVGLPEVTSYTELTDMAVLSDSRSGLRRQMQRIEQGMGRGVRSNDDYCVVLLVVRNSRRG